MPRTHKPACCQSVPAPHPRPVKYGIGQKYSDGSGNDYGMWAGPADLEIEMLDLAGKDQYSRIIRFNEDWTETELWRWDPEGQQWVEVLLGLQRYEAEVIFKAYLTVGTLSVLANSEEEAREVLTKAGFERAHRLHPEVDWEFCEMEGPYIVDDEEVKDD